MNLKDVTAVSSKALILNTLEHEQLWQGVLPVNIRYVSLIGVMALNVFAANRNIATTKNGSSTTRTTVLTV